jgi:hypothetical protein
VTRLAKFLKREWRALCAFLFFLAGFLIASHALYRAWTDHSVLLPPFGRVSYETSPIGFTLGLITPVLIALVFGAIMLMFPGAWLRHLRYWRQRETSAPLDGAIRRPFDNR